MTEAWVVSEKVGEEGDGDEFRFAWGPIDRERRERGGGMA